MKYSSLSISALTPLLAAAVDPLVSLGYTRLQGVSQAQGITQWLGVRYAAPPLGQLRFRAPIDPPATTGVVDSTKVGSQNQGGGDVAAVAHASTVPGYLPRRVKVGLFQRTRPAVHRGRRLSLCQHLRAVQRHRRLAASGHVLHPGRRLQFQLQRRFQLQRHCQLWKHRRGADQLPRWAPRLSPQPGGRPGREHEQRTEGHDSGAEVDQAAYCRGTSYPRNSRGQVD